MPRYDSQIDLVFTSIRKRSCDTDGVSAKAVIDALTHAGLLIDDSASFVRNITFNKVETGDKEKTIIEVFPVE